ncbi:hypothetical protein A2625_04090 [candidate division WOR-1 bacterium RIFCSPHIGHO2_01_FULL_53_15]|uniref:Uncharacterized protein n=1 Tax=candidate division WOR-1 bacterium RIFCSPHIGHO2_01_FULL_53_15 TaxID=1802564 RepID=A0A1F4Q0B9_UNCSA|nr:MAG: hypothetical protein A2625_04090 [candidate division WOR-1 bacterium RIFCSPHIGHO2_01_FULL_53_15]OGC12950.1 MAG: hypothetical protein A3D23_05120 [candidate division WOR-1 bacterium RIFCSPHIGHO2_02_FULL_53_26]
MFGFCLNFAAPVYAQKKAEAGETLTKGEAIMMLSATDFMKQKIGELLSWTVGYDVTKVNRVKLTPTINYVKAVPRKMPPDGRTVLELVASVDDPAGLSNISGVRADLSSIGRLPNTTLVDNGLFGDQRAADGVYTLQTSVSRSVALGVKDIPVAVANKKGWLALAKTSLDVRKNPTVTEVRFSPERALADGKTLVTITAVIDNPGRPEDVESVTADLKSLGLSEREKLEKGSGNNWSLEFVPGSSISAGTYVVSVQAANTGGGLGVGSGAITVYK